MSEKLKHANHESREALSSAEHKLLAAETDKLNKRMESQAETKRKLKEKAEHARHDIYAETAKAEKAHTSGAEKARQQIQNLNKQEKEPEHYTAFEIDSELRSVTKNRELKHIQRHEQPVERAFSKLIHQPAVRVVSEAASNTVSRPSGLLGGGIAALIGTTIYLITAKHIGFGYNYTVFLALFALGFIAGLAVEFLVYLATLNRRRARG